MLSLFSMWLTQITTLLTDVLWLLLALLHLCQQYWKQASERKNAEMWALWPWQYGVYEQIWTYLVATFSNKVSNFYVSSLLGIEMWRACLYCVGLEVSGNIITTATTRSYHQLHNKQRHQRQASTLCRRRDVVGQFEKVIRQVAKLLLRVVFAYTKLHFYKNFTNNTDMIIIIFYQFL